MQFGFKEGVGCTEALFTILESMNHMLERDNKVFGCFLDVRKAFDTVWIDGLLFKLFPEFGIRGRMWLAIRGLYTGIKAQYFTQVHCPENLMFYRVLGRVEFLPHSCTKSTLMNY